jgi:hypothetical protein
MALDDRAQALEAFRQAASLPYLDGDARGWARSSAWSAPSRPSTGARPPARAGRGRVRQVTTLRLLVTLAASVLTMVTPRIASAQAAAARAGTPPAAEPVKEAKARGEARPKRVLRLEELKVEGRIRKPQAMFLMPRANLNYGDLDRAESFTPKVAKALEREPF